MQNLASLEPIYCSCRFFYLIDPKEQIHHQSDGCFSYSPQVEFHERSEIRHKAPLHLCHMEWLERKQALGKKAAQLKRSPK
jgi:hypothetical protein